MVNRMKHNLIFLLLWVSIIGCSAGKGAQIPPAPLPTRLSNQTCPAPIPSVNIAVTQSPGEASNPVIVAKDKGFYVAWWDWFGKYPTINGVHIDDGGLPTSELTFFPGEKKCVEPTVARDMEDIHLAWIDGTRAKSAVINQAENKPRSFGESAKYAVSGPYGAVVWEERGTLYFRCDGMEPLPNRKGIVREPRPTIVAQGGIESPALAWTGEFFAVVWSESAANGRHIILQRVTNTGLLLGPRVKVSVINGHSNRPQVVWMGTQFAISWTNAAPAEHNPNGNFRIFIALVSQKGVRPSMTKQLEFNGSADIVSLATTGAEIAMAWVGTKQPAGSAVYFQRFDLAGKPIAQQIRVTDDKPVAVGRPSLSYGNRGYGVVWHDSRDFEGSEVFFSFLSCASAELPINNLGSSAKSTQSTNDASSLENSDTETEDTDMELKQVF